jgi:hypothetical protein
VRCRVPLWRTCSGPRSIPAAASHRNWANSTSTDGTTLAFGDQWNGNRLELRAQFFDLLLAFLPGGGFLINFAERALFVACSPFFGGGDTFTGRFELIREFRPDLSALVAGFVELPADFLQTGFGSRVGLSFGTQRASYFGQL